MTIVRRAHNTADIVILGAGAAGLMCAGIAGQRGRSVMLLEQARAPGEKIRISGGGRCNFTNLHTAPANFLSQNPQFCKSALKGFTQQEFIALVEKYRIAYHEKTPRAIVLRWFVPANHRHAAGRKPPRRCADAAWRRHSRSSTKNDSGFVVATDQGEYRGQSLVIATGGPSIPKMGASAFGYKLAQQFGLKMIAPRAALVPLTFDVAALAQFKDLAGVAVDAVVSVGKTKFDEALLFTHRRSQRAGDLADFVLLARRARCRHRHGADARCARRLEGGTPRTTAAGTGDGARRYACPSDWPR